MLEGTKPVVNDLRLFDDAAILSGANAGATLDGRNTYSASTHPPALCCSLSLNAAMIAAEKAAE
jgi:hypothetical protein